MRLLGLILRVYSYVFEFFFSVLLLLLGILDASTGNTIELGMLPWKGVELTHWLTGLGVVGVICTVLAVGGWFRYLFPLWALFVFVMLFRGYFLTSYAFSGPAGFREAALLTFAALLAFIGSLTVLGRANPRRSYQR